MKLKNPQAAIFVPDGMAVDPALRRITHLGIGAHQDDLEIMAFHGIQKCFNSEDLWFGAVVCTNGSGSPRAGEYAGYSDADMAALLRLLAAEPRHEKHPRASAAQVRMTENAIGRKLPPSYRSFVTAFSNGALLDPIQHVLRVGKSIRMVQSIQSEVPPIKGDRPVPIREGGAVPPDHLIPFTYDDNANYWCFIIPPGAPAAECPVAYLDPAGRQLYARLPNFAVWLHICLHEGHEVIRVIYDDSVINDELKLG